MGIVDLDEPDSTGSQAWMWVARKGLLAGESEECLLRHETFARKEGSDLRLQAALGSSRIHGAGVDAGVDLLAQVCPDLVPHFEKALHALGIELAPRPV